MVDILHIAKIHKIQIFSIKVTKAFRLCFVFVSQFMSVRIHPMSCWYICRFCCSSCCEPHNFEFTQNKKWYSFNDRVSRVSWLLFLMWNLALFFDYKYVFIWQIFDWNWSKTGERFRILNSACRLRNISYLLVRPAWRSCAFQLQCSKLVTRTFVFPLHIFIFIIQHLTKILAPENLRL